MRWTKKQTEELRQLAWHEAAHYTAARHFGLQAEAQIWPADPASDQLVLTGTTRHDATSKFRTAVIGWAGLLADEFDNDSSWAWGWYCDRRLTLDNEDLSNCYYSATDRAAVLGHPQSWRACKTAHGILVTRFGQWKQEAEELIKMHTTVWPKLLASRKRRGFTKE